MRDITDLIGRIFLSAIFIFEAFDTMLFFDTSKKTLDSVGIHSQQETLLYLALFLLFAGGLMVLTGYRSTLGAILLLLYWVPATFVLHDFWNAGSKLELRHDSILFMKNFAIIGGLLMLIGKGSGRLSIRRILSTTKVPR